MIKSLKKKKTTTCDDWFRSKKVGQKVAKNVEISLGGTSMNDRRLIILQWSIPFGIHLETEAIKRSTWLLLSISLSNRLFFWRLQTDFWLWFTCGISNRHLFYAFRLNSTLKNPKKITLNDVLLSLNQS